MERNMTFVVMWFTACAAALGGQTQKEATDEPAGQDDVPLYKVCGLRGRERWDGELVEKSLKPT